MDTKETVSPDYLEHLRKLKNESVKAVHCQEGVYVYRCFDCGHQWLVPKDCKSRLCNRCAAKLHEIRTAKVLRKIGKNEKWTHVVFSLPPELWTLVNSWDKIRLLRQGAAKIVKENIGQGGLVVVHTFGSKDYRWKPHVHCVVYGRKPIVLWEECQQDWLKFLRKHFLFGGDMVVFYEKPFFRRQLGHRVRYVLRMPPLRFDTLKHFAFCKGKAIYAFFGKGVNQHTVKISFHEKLTCPMCGSAYIAWIAQRTRKNRWIFADGWHESDLQNLV